MIVERWRRPRRMSAENPINARSESILMCASHASLSLCSNRMFRDCIYRNAAMPLMLNGARAILFYSNRMCVCVCIYGCSVLIILCARAHLVLFLLLHRMTSEGIPEGLFFFFGFFFAFERGSKCTHSKCENLESKSFEKKYILYYHHWNNKYKISKK